MSMWLRPVFGIGVLAVSSWVAGAAMAAPLTYSVVQAESNVSLTAGVNAVVDVNPDLLNTFPQYGNMTGSSNTKPTKFSNVIADVGLPGGFNDGANGITFSELSIRLQDLPGPLEGFGVISVPLDITGSSIQILGFNATFSSFRLDINAPFSSALTPTGNPDEWLWAGPADVTLSGTIAPVVFVPTVGPVPLGSFPFSQALTMPLAGTFAGIPTGTEINVGIPSGTLHDQNLSLPPIDVPLNLVELGLITAYFHLDTLTLADISTSVVYRSATPVPEPGTAALLVLGLAGLAARRCRR
jgi:hypothetical protein